MPLPEEEASSLFQFCCSPASPLSRRTQPIRSPVGPDSCSAVAPSGGICECGGQYCFLCSAFRFWAEVWEPSFCCALPRKLSCGFCPGSCCQQLCCSSLGRS